MSSEATAVPAVEETAPAPAPIAKDDSVHVDPISESITTPIAGTEPESTESASAPIPKSELVSLSKSVEEEKPIVPSKDVVEPTQASPATPAKDAVPTLTPLAKLLQELPAIYEEAEYREMWGIELSESPDTHIPTSIVATKFLRANSNDVAKAKKQLVEALQWRKKMEPLKLLETGKFDKSKYGDLGFVTTYQGTKGKEIVTWNIYGAVKDNKATFGNVDEFIQWRCALMELSIAQLSLHDATIPIPESGPDPYRMIQVHDYLNVSFLRMDPAVKAASKQTIQTFSMAYPELLKEKFFVNVPLLMSWVFAAMKLFLSPETVKKFHPLGYGEKLAGELPEFGEKLPKAYGGKGESLIGGGLTVKYIDEAQVVSEGKEDLKKEMSE